MRAAAAALLLLFTGLAAAAAETEEKTAPPPAGQATAEARLPERPAALDGIEQLFRLQDAAAAGLADAAPAQKRLLQQIAAALEESPAGDAPRLAAYASAYVLSGGDPRTADRLGKAEGISPRDRQLLQAAALFMRGERDEASRLFSEIDTQALPAQLTGRVALARSLLEKDAKERQALLARAMAEMPGTLIEESALRRSALSHAEAREERGFWLRLERYQRRFARSVYAPAFWEEAMGAIATWSAKGLGPALQRLDPILSEMPVARRRALYLSLARRAAAAGVPGATEFAARRLGRLAQEGSAEGEAATLYAALYAVAEPGGEEARRRLTELRPDLLAPQDRALRTAALAIGGQIDGPPAAEKSTPPARPEDEPLLLRGQGLLNDTQKLLADGQ